MDVEFGLKLTKTIDDPSSFKDFQLGKDQAGPVFLSREDVNAFILTVHLRGQCFLHLSKLSLVLNFF